MHTQKKTFITGVILTLVGGLFWGLSGTCGQYLFTYKNVTANWLVPLRLTLAGFLLLLYYTLFFSFVPKEKQPEIPAGKLFPLFRVFETKKNRHDIILYSLFGLMLCQFTYFKAIELSNAGTATVIQYIGPILVLLTICIMSRRFPTGLELLAVILAFGGIFLLATHGNIHSLTLSGYALFMGLLSAASIVVYTLQPKKLMEQFPAPYLLGWAMFIGGLILMFVFRPFHAQIIWDLETVLCLVGVIFLGTILSFSFYMTGVKLVGPQKASLYACIEPIASAFLSAVWLKVPFAGLDYVGFALVISTIFITSIPSRKK